MANLFRCGAGGAGSVIIPSINGFANNTSSYLTFTLPKGIKKVKLQYGWLISGSTSGTAKNVVSVSYWDKTSTKQTITTETNTGASGVKYDLEVDLSQYKDEEINIDLQCTSTSGSKVNSRLENIEMSF